MVPLSVVRGSAPSPLGARRPVPAARTGARAIAHLVPLAPALQARVARPRRKTCTPIRAAAAAAASNSGPPPEGIQWMAQLVAADAVRSGHFSLWQYGLAVAAQVLGAVALARAARLVCEFLAKQAQKRVEAEFLITAEEVSDEETIGLSNTAISYLSIAFGLSRIRHLFMPLVILLAVYKCGTFIEEAIYVKGLNVSWFGGKLADCLTSLRQFELWVFLRAGAIFAIIMATVFSTETKDRAVDLILQRQTSMALKFTGWMKMLKPLSTVATFVIWVAAALNILLVWGVDVRKYMLAVGSVSGLAVGIGAQSLISSVLSGVNLFLTVPFLVGDRVELRDASGNTVMIGVVEGLKLCSTVFRLDSGLPVEVPNSSLTTLMICNQSRTKEADEVEKQSFQSDPRALNMSISVELAADKGVAEQIPNLVSTIELFLERGKDVDTDMPISCTLEKFTGSKTANLNILVHSNGEADYDAFMMQVMLGIATVVETNNCTCCDLVPSKQS
mmetsp:Transcript_48084/g.121356  ORF Transcript_48084/g.121356 Transcript_48084/m.121356 type:complete len:503 (-) Transcript_48084:856-2364(-)